MIRTRTPLAVAVVGALALVACGGDDSSTDGVAEPAAATVDSEMSDDEMSDDEMSDDEMSDDEMSDDEMSDEMSDDEMSDDEMSDDEMSDDEMSDDEMSDDEMSDESMNDVMSVITNHGDLTVLDEAIHAAGLQDTLHDGGPFTVFAPSDAAFASYLGEMGMSADELLADVDALTNLLQAHVVSGSDDSAMVMEMAGEGFTTLAGNELSVSVDGDIVMVGDATVLEYDVAADNGIVHIIDTVLTPPAG